ncbi:hypothetical protein [Pseudoleptotrichia goodfellowii]|uniref:Uncharacterized protein n=1 Tax=Pseudoleptotrichia goodfellowii F0264 TaxID=596323 RepID=D0GMY9_9FUSO|nr:hypothetical protein [Pseudoleptotrichia goodfellowii]EEY34543.1 hypothetical protein HMPREF0554_0264 [Pseudoleptotrichia goodfellowii F0264]
MDDKTKKDNFKGIGESGKKPYAPPQIKSNPKEELKKEKIKEKN